MRGIAREARLVGTLVCSMATLVFALAAAVPASAAFDCGAYVERCRVAIDNSGRVWFNTIERLTEDALGDGTLRGGVFQVYQRVGGATTLIKGPGGAVIPAQNKQNVAAYLSGGSPDGSRIYIRTDASLSPEDGDGGHEYQSIDYYEISGDRYTLLSTGPLDGPFPNPLATRGTQRLFASDDGSRVYFETAQPLTDDDWDDASDVYERSAGLTRLVSTGPAETPIDPNTNERALDAEFLGASPDGAVAYFSTAERLTADDTEKRTSDIYAWRAGVTARVTQTLNPELHPGSPYESFGGFSYGGVANDGTLIYIAQTPQTPDDTDSYTDLYAARPDGTKQRLTSTPPGTTYGSAAEEFLRPGAVSADGSRVFFMTGRSMLPDDDDGQLDIYRWSSGNLQLVTTGSGELRDDLHPELHLQAISRDGRRAYFNTWERRAAEDTDDHADVYEWNEGVTRLVSPAADGKQSHSFFMGISPNGRYVAFATWEDLIPGDNDLKEDIYLVDMRPGPAGATAASASRRRPGKGRKRRRLRLVTAEEIPPRMRVAAVARVRKGSIRLRLRCPKSERSGACRGRAKLLRRGSRRPLAAGRFRIIAGRRAAVTLHARRLIRRLPPRAIARVRGVDLLGNAATVARTVRLRRVR